MSAGYYDTFSEAWLEEIDETRYNGEVSSPRGMKTREQRWRQIVVHEPLSFPVAVKGRQFRDVIGVLEGLSLVGQVSIPETFTSRVAKFGDFLDDGVFHGAYATRAHGAIGEVVNLLTRDPDSRQAVISVFDSSRDLNRIKSDIPCTIALHFMKRGKELEMNATMRSNDMWLGTPYDFTQFAILQATIAQALKLKPGLYVHSAGSLHLYERDFTKVDLIDYDDEANTDRMDFPLWGADDIGEISSRARALLLNPKDFQPTTMFERWAQTHMMLG
jgi:thymidylate synthase